jgi:rhamnogalacturonan endolyase
MVYDFDGCGKAEVIMKTAPGTRDGTGAFIKTGPAASLTDADHNIIYRNANGHIVTGPEYLTVFEGATGRELATAEYWPLAGTVSSWGGVGRDNGGNRVNRFNAVVAYLDGARPSVVYQRGYYERMTFAAWNWRNGQLTRQWTFDTGTCGSSNPNPYCGQGNHSLSVADVDNSGRHSIITGSAVIGPDGTGKHTKGYGHGDALHVAHMIKDHPTPQIFMVHETGNIGLSLRHANTGDVIFTVNNNTDVGRGVAAELDASRPGFKFWSSANENMYGIGGNIVGSHPMIPNNGVSYNFVIWWGGDLTRALLDRNQINRWNVSNNSPTRLLTAIGAVPANDTKRTPVLTADIFGDWREEVIWAYGNDALRIYTTTTPTTHRLVTLMHDPTYRVAVAWQNSSYNQPPHPGYYIASDMNFPPPQLNVAVVGSTPNPCAAAPGSTACCDANPSHSSCQTTPPDWVLIGSGEFIDDLVTFDIPNAHSWSIHDNFATQEKAFGDREYLVITIPEELLGAEWISTSMETRRVTSLNTIISFTMKKDGLVSIAYEDRVGTKPAWLADAGFEETERTISVRDNSNPANIIDRTFTIYEKLFLTGEIVSTGINSNDGTAQSLMYLIAVTEPKATSVLVDKTRILNNSLSVMHTGNGIRINYSIKNRGNVRIDMFDIKGNRIRTLVNTSKNAGTYREQVSIDGLAAGMYIVRLNAGKQTLRKKVLLTR